MLQSYYIPMNKCVTITQPRAQLCDTPAMIQMSVNIHNCCVSVSRGLSDAATIQWATAKSLAECQAVLDRHHIVKYRVHCAGEIVETSCKILANVDSNRYLIHFKHFYFYCLCSVTGGKTFSNCNSYKNIYCLLLFVNRQHL